jgi:hypothetical protein
VASGTLLAYGFKNIKKLPLKKYQFSIVTVLFCAACIAQQKPVIDKAEVARIERILSADSMEGRATGKPGITKAANFIASEFRQAGLSVPEKQSSFLQSFAMITPTSTGASATLDRSALPAANIIAITSKPELRITEQSGFRKVQLKAGSNFGTEVPALLKTNENLLVLVDTSFRANFSRINRLKRQVFESDKSVVFLLTENDPKVYEISATHEVSKVNMANVVGIIPGRSKKDEYVIFSGHYDHLGIGKPVEGDSIYNGANDDAAGITAVIMLAKYFKSLGNNERTLVFAAFTAEESGGFGSQYFSSQFNPQQVMAMFNIEMIGTESKWGKNSAYITGYDQTNMGKILEKNLAGTGFTFYPDPYPQQQLFYRSDNATLARQGVPAHTISTSKMDSEKYYHTVDDEFETLDMDNMAKIIEAIALSSRTIVSGEDAPTRVNTQLLR